MHGLVTAAEPIEVLANGGQAVPLVLASPHSGADYPVDFLAASRLDALTLRRSEDSFVDEIFGAAPALGAPLLRARFPRAYVDVNREPFELDPTMFEDLLPNFVNSHSPRVRVGLGTIARVVASGEEIYARKLKFSEAAQRIETLYRPYHRTLKQLLDATQERYSFCILLDCHSMPSASGDRDRRDRSPRADMVLGDCHGTACHPVITETAHRVLNAKGYSTALNTPYAGGFTTAHYGRPTAGVHCLQIEINRALYMDERTFERKPFLAQLGDDMRDLTEALSAIDPELLRPA
ncbi:MAG: N-formylglutamate amidohydrolase [Alphaproteobacteria bacterium]|nr:N-formylglutamate amidohydrolase [Alphaproteobacteria bacterium]MDE1967471.1 N-formylglutamate amidohydrolase [Alphaproteobacteria bacterium]MDE2512710.1 N-formylglutamate amidohydrolase [Alphaproteobacteria bacterium]